MILFRSEIRPAVMKGPDDAGISAESADFRHGHHFADNAVQMNDIRMLVKDFGQQATGKELKGVSTVIGRSGQAVRVMHETLELSHEKLFLRSAERNYVRQIFVNDSHEVGVFSLFQQRPV